MLFRSQVTNEANRTYFHGPRWTEMTNNLQMEPRTKLHFDLDCRNNITYYSYEGRDSYGIDSYYYFHDPRDEDGVIVHYPLPTADEDGDE